MLTHLPFVNKINHNDHESFIVAEGRHHYLKIINCIQ